LDWRGFKAKIPRENCPAQAFLHARQVFRQELCQSLPVERQQALIDGHIRAFAFFGGVLPWLIHDNPTIAVQKVHKVSGHLFLIATEHEQVKI